MLYSTLRSSVRLVWAARLAAAVGAISAAGAAMAANPADKPGSKVGLIEIEETPRERPTPMSAFFTNAGGSTLRDIIGLIHGAAEDDELNGLVIRLRGPQLGLTQVEEVGAALNKVRAAGKKVHVFSEWYETSELLLGSYADEVVIQSGGPVSLPGMYMEEMYLADTLAWAGIKADLIQVGDYKGANEQMVNTSPSPQWDQNINSLLDGLYGRFREQIKAGRKLDDQKLDDAMRQAWLASETTAKHVGLIDTALDLPELSAHLEKSYGTEIAWDNILSIDENAGSKGLNISNPLAIFGQLAGQQNRQTDGDTIAVVHIDGPIVDGESTSGGFSGESQVGSWTMRRALGEIEEDDNVKGVIVRVNSPGGSAVASEVIWQGLRRIAAEKPVWVSIGSMAASGGYYIAVAGDRIYANPSSIVGSIGVVGGKLSMSGVFDNLKIKTVGRSRGPMGAMQSSRPWSDAERVLVREKMQETYELFASRVSQGRKGMDLSKTAEGRLFTGKDAVGLGMADKVGGLNDTIVDLATELKLAEGEYDVLDYPSPKGLGDVLGELLGGMAMAGANNGSDAGAARSLLFGTIREAVGPRAWPGVRGQLDGLMQLREEPVLLVSPSAIIVR